MIGWEDVCKVVVAIAPLYVALMLGYGSVKWWRMFTPEQCEAINRLVCYFTYPLFVFEFTAHVDPFKMNYLFMAADAISKVIIVVVLSCWARWWSSSSSKGSYCWSITSFSLSTLTSSLVVGVPFLNAMYGHMAVDLVVQSSVFQALVWLTILMFVFEVRRTRNDQGNILVLHHHHHHHQSSAADQDHAAVVNIDLENQQQSSDAANYKMTSTSSNSNNLEVMGSGSRPSLSFWKLMKEVCLKLAKNPNSYACVLGVAWASLSNRMHFEMPSIMEGSILIMSRAGTGTAMFSMGLFTAAQKKVIACGASLTIFGMALRFIAGPLAMALGSLAVGLHGNVLRVAIIQAALPQSITSFIFANEYGLHADVLSTTVIFSMIVGLPVLIGYYAILEFVH